MAAGVAPCSSPSSAAQRGKNSRTVASGQGLRKPSSAHEARPMPSVSKSARRHASGQAARRRTRLRAISWAARRMSGSNHETQRARPHAAAEVQAHADRAVRTKAKFEASAMVVSATSSDWWSGRPRAKAWVRAGETAKRISIGQRGRRSRVRDQKKRKSSVTNPRSGEIQAPATSRGRMITPSAAMRWSMGAVV